MFYFSGTGNTWWAASELKRELEALGVSVEMYSLENPELRKEGFVSARIAEADQVIIGFPIYSSDMPHNMRDFIRALPEVKDGKKFCAFCTQAGFSGDGSVFFRKEMELKGYRFLQAFQINLTTNFNVAMLPFSQMRPESGAKLEKIRDKASAKIKAMAGRIAAAEQYLEGTRFDLRLLGSLMRLIFRIGEKRIPRKFKFIQERCSKCGFCQKTCPTDNIVLDPELPDLKRKDNCIFCFRCYNFCPTLAIHFGGDIKHPERYLRFKGPVDGMRVQDIMK